MKKFVCITVLAALVVVFYSCKKDNVKPSSNHVTLKVADSHDSTGYSGGQEPPVIK